MQVGWAQICPHIATPAASPIRAEVSTDLAARRTDSRKVSEDESKS
jgi:hypothetical protein